MANRSHLQQTHEKRMNINHNGIVILFIARVLCARVISAYAGQFQYVECVECV